MATHSSTYINIYYHSKCYYPQLRIQNVQCHVSFFHITCSGEDKGRARRAQHDQFFYLKLFFSMPIMDDKMPILRGAF